MPAPPSSLIDPALGHLVQLAAGASGEQPGLLGVLAQVADPRHRRGVRHRLAGILGLALCAVVAGARSFTAIAEWAADADGQTLHVLGVRGAVPSESTFRRTLQRLDGGAFDDLAGAWAQQATMPGPGGRRVIAVDGKTLRGSAGGGNPGDHLLAALDHAHGAVLGQVEAGAKTSEIRPGGRAGCLGGPLDCPGADSDPGQVSEQRGGLAERDLRAGPGDHLGQARRQRRPGCAQLLVPGRGAVPAFAAVIPARITRTGPSTVVMVLGRWPAKAAWWPLAHLT
jgi:hypothetical protein